MTTRRKVKTNKATKAKPTAQELQARIDRAFELAKDSMSLCEFEDSNYTMYFLDQIMRVLLAKDYRKLTSAASLWEYGKTPDKLHYDPKNR